MKKFIFITGFMGSGKTRIGRALASRINWQFIDTDKRIEIAQNKKVTKIFETEGEKQFRKYETWHLKEIIKEKEKHVVSLGGGALISTANRKLIQKNGILIYLESSLEEIWNRVKDKKNRPLLFDVLGKDKKKTFLIKAEKLLQKRIKGYKSADIVINRVGCDCDDIIEDLINQYKEKLPI